MTKRGLDLKTRLELASQPEPNSGCVLWLLRTNAKGYGTIKVATKSLLAHRVVWQECKGEIPYGLQVLHKCDTPGCVNVEHLFLGTHFDNMEDKVRKNRQAQLASDLNGRTKLTYDQVAEIRKLAIEGERPIDLANRFGVTATHIISIRDNATWKCRGSKGGNHSKDPITRSLVGAKD